jgi:alpha-galactosidase
MRPVLVALLLCCCFTSVQAQMLAEKPPMGWNSYNCFGSTVTEAEVKSNADHMKALLADFGWEYVVVDYCWSYPTPGAMGNPPQTEDFKPRLTMDKYGRLMPVVERFPSAAGGKGFKPLADYIHGLGLKFGIHVMRGIPRQAVSDNVPIMGTNLRAQDIVDMSSTCPWLNHMYGIDETKPGAQEYYDSLIKLYADWGVDYIKVDDILARDKYHSWDVEALNKAIEKCGRPIVLSLSPGGGAKLEQAEHLKQYPNLWRISADFWDSWEQLEEQFDLCAQWAPHITPGHWPDADMLTLGRLGRRGPENQMDRISNFTKDEQCTLMTLWSIFRSPLMMGGDLNYLDHFTRDLLTNREVLEVNQNSTNNRQLFRRGNHVAWVADVPGSRDKYVAAFNLGEDPETPVYISLDDVGFSGRVMVRDLWKNQDLQTLQKAFAPVLAPHGGGLYRLTPQ